ncbi:MAG: DUF1345 domain-containing protein [Propionibacteriaceae bacterium]|jgi:uncharacterized membrane protein|nr:DUF1345 domain-containing protein [Propionibacteriaceae bacterium]
MRSSNTVSWHSRAWFRLLVAVLIGLAVASAVAWWWQPAYAALLGWTATALVYVITTWLALGPMDAAATAAHATREAPGNALLHLLLVAAGLASLVGLVLLIAAGDQSRAVTAAVAVCPVVASWATIHTLYALRYAQEYYRHDGGVDFHCDQPPCYTDFAYLAFTLGFSYAVSDTDLASSRLRRIALGHALLAYLFGTVFVAALVNILASLSP